MYRLSLDPVAEDQIKAAPQEALRPLAELFTLLETAPWSGQPFNPANPRGNMLTHEFGELGLATYLVLEEQREVYLLFLEEDGLLEEAEQCYRIAAEVNYPAARNRLACLLKETGRREEAETWHRRALDKRAESCDVIGDDDYAANTNIMYNLAVLLEETDRPQEALDLYHQAAARGDAEATQDIARLERR
ncbi:hypothetical protein GCM10029978_113590 [Actinoallomurus acanthiterrae]